MENLKIYYDGSGVKTLRAWAILWILFSVIGIILILIGVLGIINTSYYNSVSTLNIILIGGGVSIFLLGLILAPIFRGLATIAEAALIYKHRVEEDYEIIDADSSEE